MEEARRSLGLSHRYYEHFAAEETLLARTDATIDEVRSLLDELWPVKDDAPTLTRQRGDERGDTVVSLFEKESARVGSTAYAAERAVTDYVDHYATIRPSGALKGNELGARGARLLDGADDEVKAQAQAKDKAHRKLMLLVRR